MSVDIENNYEPQYINIRGKGPLINDLKKEAKKANKVFLASDPDREGEAISWHLAHILDLDENDANRVVFNEITKDAVKNAFKEPRKIDMDLVDAQQARRVLDRLVGYSISPILWKKVKKGLSAGRVQSVALKLIIDRENEINAFQPEEYWTIDGVFKKGTKQFQASFYGMNGKKMKLTTNEEVKEVLSHLTSKDFTVDQVDKKERKRNAPLPYTTSTMQMDAANKINFRTRKTMMVAQQLYEGINIGSGVQGLITYMRTDSTRISPVAQNEAASYINNRFGSKYSKHGSKVKNASGAQDAHEAIRPSSVFNTPESIAKYLDKDQLKLYTLIWNRFVASQMTAAIFDTMAVKLSQNGVQFAAMVVKLSLMVILLSTMTLTRTRCCQIWLLEMWSSRSIASQNNISLNRQLAIRKRLLSRHWKKMELAVRQPTLRPLKPSKNVTTFVWLLNVLNRQNWEKLLTSSSLNTSQTSSM